MHDRYITLYYQSISWSIFSASPFSFFAFFNFGIIKILINWENKTQNGWISITTLDWHRTHVWPGRWKASPVLNQLKHQQTIDHNFHFHIQQLWKIYVNSFISNRNGFRKTTRIEWWQNRDPYHLKTWIIRFLDNFRTISSNNHTAYKCTTKKKLYN